MRTVAVILAAGASRRLGHPKQLVEIDGEPLVHRIARVALEVCDRVAVVEGAVPLEETLADLPVTTVHNAVWDEGIGSSIRAGIAWASSADAALLLTCDQVELDAAHLLRLVYPGAGSKSRPLHPGPGAGSKSRPLHPGPGAGSKSRPLHPGPGLLTASRYANTLGIPAVFPRAWFPALFALRGDRGARPLLTGALAIDWPAGQHDLDTPADLAARLRR